MKKGAKSYQQVSAQGKVEDASPHRLIQMMFEAAIEAMKVSKVAIQDKQILLKVQKINKAFDIVESLRGCLNMEVGGEMAENLDQLYEYLLFRIMQVNATNDLEMCDHVAKVLQDLLDTWNQIPPEEHHITSMQADGTMTGSDEAKPSTEPPLDAPKPEPT